MAAACRGARSPAEGSTASPFPLRGAARRPPGPLRGAARGGEPEAAALRPPSWLRPEREGRPALQVVRKRASAGQPALAQPCARGHAEAPWRGAEGPRRLSAAWSPSRGSGELAGTMVGLSLGAFVPAVGCDSDETGSGGHRGRRCPLKKFLLWLPRSQVGHSSRLGPGVSEVTRTDAVRAHCASASSAAHAQGSSDTRGLQGWLLEMPPGTAGQGLEVSSQGLEVSGAVFNGKVERPCLSRECAEAHRG